MDTVVYQGKIVFDGLDYLYCNYDYLSGDMISCYGLGKQEAFPLNLLTSEVDIIKPVDYPLKGLPDMVTFKNSKGVVYRIKKGDFESSLYLVSEGTEHLLQNLINLHQLCYACDLDEGSDIQSDIDSEYNHYLLKSQVDNLFDIPQLVFQTNLTF